MAEWVWLSQENSSLDSGNMTEGNNDIWGRGVSLFLSIVLSLIIVVSATGNSLVLFVILGSKRMRTKTNTFIANLAVADLGVTVLCMPFSLVTLLVGDYKFGMVVCNINAFCDALFLVASIHGLTGISLQKYFALVRPLSRVITRRRIKYMIAMAWLTATVSAIGPLIGWSENTYKPGSSQCGPKYPETIGEYLHGYYNLVVALVIPLLVCLFVYISVFNASRQYSKRLQRNTTFDVERIFKQQIQIVKTIFVIVITFFFCWTPYFIYAAWVLWGDHNNIPFWFNTVAYMSGFANSALNPIIYALRTVSFKRELRKMFGFAKSGSPDSSGRSIFVLLKY